MGAHGEEEHLAPVIPLFGGSAEERNGRDGGSQEAFVPRRTGGAGLWRSALADGENGAQHDPGALHPAHRSGAGRAAVGERDADGDRREGGPGRRRSGMRVIRSDETADDNGAGDQDEVRAHAEALLVRRLRAKALSVSEARSVLREGGLSGASAEDVLDDFQQRRYIDDRTLAELLVTSGVERKGQGRVALSRALAQRGIPREIIDEALAELPDDDAERALEFARGKARSMTNLEPDTALRRLIGQLSRRGYGGSVAMNAARTALREATSGSSRGVRFVESD